MNSNNSNQPVIAIGLMSGTSMDGIDGALLKTDGENYIEDLGNCFLPYDAEFRLLLKACELSVRENNGDLNKAQHHFNNKNKSVTFDQIIEKSTDLHAQLIHKLLEKYNYKNSDIKIVGYHGQTLFHSPARKITIQIGDAQRLANEVGINVIYDFRSNDIKHGGQGAPFAPLYHQALARQLKFDSIAVVNCGGISNITIAGISNNDLYAYDCGPGNALIDRFVQLKTGETMDKDGHYGEKGRVFPEILLKLKQKAVSFNDNNYLDIKPPKSLDINDIKLLPEVENLTLEDGCATLEAFTAECIVDSLKLLSVPIPKMWILAGGGWKNKVITNELKNKLKKEIGSDVSVQYANEIGWNGQAMEAQVFAYLAVRSLYKLPLSLPGTTGVLEPLTGGKIVCPETLPNSLK